MGLLVAALAVIAVVIKVHPLADQQNWRVLALCVPSLVALGTLVRSVRPAAG